MKTIFYMSDYLKKHNIALTHIDDHNKIHAEMVRIRQELNEGNRALRDNLNEEQRDFFDNSLKDIYKIWLDNSITLCAKTLKIQEYVMDLVPLMRKYNTVYNPNFLIFHESAKEPVTNIEDILKKMGTKIPLDFNPSTPNNIVEEIVKQTLPIYLQNKKLNLEEMSEKESEFCTRFLEKYSPDYYLNLIKNL